jgi:Leucine-rich repeat (LRR) protein
MKELFPYNNSKAAYNFIKNFLQDNYKIEKINGKLSKDSFNISFKYNSLEPDLSVKYFDQESFSRLHLVFYPFPIYGDETSYSLTGWEINISNLKQLMKLCKYTDIPKCKICGKHPIKYYEECINKNTYKADITGNPYLHKYQKYNIFRINLKLHAVCSCGNKWILKDVISASQIKDLSTLKNDLKDYIDRNDKPRILTENEIDEMLTGATEYAKLENKKPLRTVVLSKKEIKTLLDAIHAGDVKERKKSRLPKLIKRNDFLLQKLLPKEDTKLFEELMTLYAKNEAHIFFWHKKDADLNFKDTEDYLNYLHKEKKACYVILMSNKVIGCIEVGQLSTDNNSLKHRYLSFWIDESHARKGIMSTALCALEDSLCSKNLDYLMTNVDSKNEPSVKLMEKLNYTVKTRVSSMLPESGQIVETIIEFRKNYNNYSPAEIEAKFYESCREKCLQHIEQCKKRKYKKLNLSVLHISDLPIELSELTWLEEISLFGNSIEQLPEWIGNFTELAVLNLCNNKLTSLPDSFANLKKLKTLSLAQNNLKILPEWFDNITELRCLDISYNKIKKYPDVIKRLPKLKKFFDSGNLYNSEESLILS